LAVFWFLQCCIFFVLGFTLLGSFSKGLWGFTPNSEMSYIDFTFFMVFSQLILLTFVFAVTVLLCLKRFRRQALVILISLVGLSLLGVGINLIALLVMASGQTVVAKLGQAGLFCFISLIKTIMVVLLCRNLVLASDVFVFESKRFL